MSISLWVDSTSADVRRWWFGKIKTAASLKKTRL